MGGDQRRDRQKSEVGSRSSLERGEAASSANRAGVREGEFEAPTRPRGRALADSEMPAEPRAGSSELRTTLDSFHPVRVPARTVRPPLSLWTRAWATVALVIVVVGGAIGIVASLRARTNGPGGRSAAAAGITAPPPLAPTQPTSRNAGGSVSAGEVPPIGSSPGAVSPRVLPSAVAFRTPDSLAHSPVIASSSGAALPLRRPKPLDPAPPMGISLPLDESAHAPTPAPVASDTPEKQGESEAWVTEERRF